MGMMNFSGAVALNVPTPAAGDSSTTAASTAFVQSVMPAGVVLPFAGPLPPTGWLLCDSSPVSRTLYPKLFAAIGTTYGVGNGSTTFNLPELRGEFVRGGDNGRGVDAARALGSFQQPTFIRGVMDDAYGSDVTNTQLITTIGQSTAFADSLSTGASIGQTNVKLGVNGTTTRAAATADNAAMGNLNASDGVPDTFYSTRPRNVAMNYIIKST